MNEHPPIGLHTTLTRNHEMLFTQVDNDKVMFDLATSKYLGLNPVASTIFDLLEQPHTVATLCTALLARYEVDAETCQRETLVVLERMRGFGIVQVAGESAA